MVLHHNITALNAHRNWTTHNNNAARALERISSGKRINRAADDPAGLAISEQMKLQLTLLETDKSKVTDYMSMLETADGSMNEINRMLNRMLELANLSSNGTCSELERKNMDAEYQQLLHTINQIGNSCSLQTKKLFQKFQTDSQEPLSNDKLVIQGNNLNAYLDALDALLVDISAASKKEDSNSLLLLGIDLSNGRSNSENLHDAVLQFTKEQGDRLLNTPSEDGSSNGLYTLVLSGGNIEVKMPQISQESLGLTGTNLLSAEGSRDTISAIQHAMESVSSWRGDVGATYNRLEHTMNSLSNMEMNLTDALSRITDADIAKEMMIFVKEQMLSQASMFVMAQASHKPEEVLTLIHAL